MSSASRSALSLGRAPRPPFAVRAPTAPVESRCCRGRTRPHRAPLTVDPATFIEELVGVDLADFRSPLAAELHPRGFVLRSDERKRATPLPHSRCAPRGGGAHTRTGGARETPPPPHAPH